MYPYLSCASPAKFVPNTIAWGTIRGQLQAWPLYPGEVVEIEEASLGYEGQVMTAVCLAHLSGAQEPLYLACHKDDCPRAVVVSKQRPAVEQQNRDLKSNLLLRKLHLKNAARLERMWIILGIAFYISSCNETVHASAFRDRTG